MSEDRRPKRRPTRIPGFDYSTPNWYFVTVCTANRLRLFGRVVDEVMRLNHFGQIVADTWVDLPNHHESIALDAFVVMPNHLHGIIKLNVTNEDELGVTETHESSLTEVVRGFKTYSARRINAARGVSGIPVWQRSFHDHIIRSERAYDRIYEYILNNPLGWDNDTYYTDGDADS